MSTLIFIILGSISRLIPHPPNFTPIGGIALFASAKYGIRKSLFIVVSSMFISDAILGFHSVMWATYGSLALAVLLGKMLSSRKGFFSILGITSASSVIFFLITNFAVWLIPGSIYPKSFAGLCESYIMAIPFFRNSLFGDIFYTNIFFGLSQLLDIINVFQNQRFKSSHSFLS